MISKFMRLNHGSRVVSAASFAQKSSRCIFLERYYYPSRKANLSTVSSNLYFAQDLSEPTEEQKMQMERLRTIQKKKEELEPLLEDQVRTLLHRQFPKAFSAIRQSSDLVVWTEEEKDLSKSMRILSALNGYTVVDIPKATDRIPMAQGVLLKPNFFSRLPGVSNQKFILLSQKMHYQYSEPKKKHDKSFPALVEDDITIYRLLESRVDEFLDAKYQSFRSWLSTNVERPLAAAIEKIARRRNNEENDKETDIMEIETMYMEDDDGSDENLIVIAGKHDMKLVSNMDPSLRLLSLPHSLGHKPASTMISVSLVVFGALPLSYRSLNFVLEYPGLSEVIAASVVATVTYGIWSARDYARTSQARAISQAISSRLYARDDGLLWVLQEGAVRRLTKSIVELYFHEYMKEEAIGTNPNELIQEAIQLPTLLVDPWEVCTELGLLVQAENDGSWKAAPFEHLATNLAESKV